MSAAPLVLPPEWVLCENKKVKPKCPEGYEYQIVNKWSCCGTLGCIICWPIECLANMTPFWDNSPEGNACDMMKRPWWHLQKSQ